MSVPYIPENTKVVCTLQTDSSPKELIITRGKVSVIKKSEDTPLLTEKDLNINEQFACKNAANAMASFFAIAAGIVVGAALIASGPVGWVVAGVAAAGFAAAGTYHATQIKHKCSPGLEAGQWNFTHHSVKLDGHPAITQISILSCNEGGILSPIIDPAVAQQAAEAIASNNKKEIGVNAAASFVTGLFLPFGVSGVAGASTLGLKFLGGAKMAGGFVFGIAFMQGATWLQSDYTRSHSLPENEAYDRMNEVESGTFTDAFSIPDDPSDLSNILDPIELQQAIKSGQLAGLDARMQNRLSHIEGLSRQRLLRDPEAKQLLAELKEGKHPQLRQAITNFNNRRINPTMRNQMNTANRQNMTNNLKDMGRSGVTGVMYFAPFAAKYFSEEARITMAEALTADTQSGGNIIATQV
ncbi:DUF4280 domain-containing protein [Sinomicrobium pectinilyticum]|uniref:DUF4280 domain-containing protein n=1 Tax=Sinomicrobium pectinilyticum TaxID=1084421 RepID=A0A3N0EDM3_SINP1|nr:PAAR-like protein [Sinomicrobium pectinilyticum]RNL85957.1 DUF4280 domain-containing protein [Sinomicrobium pectinilyticum]